MVTLVYFLHNGHSPAYVTCEPHCTDYLLVLLVTANTSSLQVNDDTVHGHDEPVRRTEEVRDSTTGYLPVYYCRSEEVSDLSAYLGARY